MAKNKHTFAKRQREMEKKLKAEEKRARRQRKKEASDTPADAPDDGECSTASLAEDNQPPLPGPRG